MVRVRAERRDAHRRKAKLRRAAAACVTVCLVLVGLGGAGRASARTPGSYPRTANVYFPTLTGVDLEQLARYDLLVLPARGQEWCQEELATLRALNPDILLLAHMPVGYHGDWEAPAVFRDVREAANEHDWWLRDRLGHRVLLPCGDYILNLTEWCPPDEDGRILSDWLAKHIADRLGPGGLWDGVYLDYCMDDIAWAGSGLAWGIDADGNGQVDDSAALDAAWRSGTERFVTRLRGYVGDDYLIVTNGNNTLYDTCDGGTREDFPHMHGDWLENVTAPGYGYIAMQTRYRQPAVNIINTIWHGPADPSSDMPDPSAEQKLGYTLATTLIYGDGYYSFDGGRGLPDHCQMWWHELFELDLGFPLERGRVLEAWPGGSPWVANGDMVAARRFSRGLAVVNPSTCSQRVELGGVYYPTDSWNGSFYPYERSRSDADLGYCTGAFYVGTGAVLTADLEIALKRGIGGDVLLTWKDISGAVAYAVYRSETRGRGPEELVAIVDGPQFRDDGAGPRGSVRYRVSPIDELLCEGAPSESVSEESVDDGGIVEAEMSGEPGGRDGAGRPGAGILVLDGRGGPDGDFDATGGRVALLGASPNPARSETSVAFTAGAGAGGEPVLTLFDVRGRAVRSIRGDRAATGMNEIRWDLRHSSGERVASGCYLYALSVGDETLRGKLLVLD